MRRLSAFERARSAVARWIAPSLPTASARAVRAYAHARQTNTTAGFGASGDTSADAELHLHLGKLRARSRQMLRDSAYARRARTLVVNNVIGNGIGMQAQVSTTRDGLNARVNADIERAWDEWSVAGSCHTGGMLHFSELERALLGQVFDAGDVLVRLHFRRFGDSQVPLALELIEAERLPNHQPQPITVEAGNEFRMGVEVDRFGRPVAYWIRERHPGDLRITTPGATDRYERVPADQIIPLYRVDRWPQTRGEPWMHAVLRKLDSLAEYSQLEVDAARASATLFATVENPEGEPPKTEDGTADTAAGSTFAMDPLSIIGLEPGEQLKLHDPSRPNPNFDPFVRAVLREIAVGVGTSYASLSGDYSQSNYSSSRLALLDDRDLWRSLQQWWIRSFREPLLRRWLGQAVLAGAIPTISRIEYGANPRKFEAVSWKPRGWSWIDPTKEVAAYKEAIRAGMTTLTDVIAQTAGGKDIEDMVATRRRELDLLEEQEIPSDVAAPESAAQPAQPDPEDDAPEPAARVVALSARTA